MKIFDSNFNSEPKSKLEESHMKETLYFTTARTIKKPVGDHSLEITDSLNPFFQACLTQGKNTGRMTYKKNSITSKTLITLDHQVLILVLSEGFH